MSNEDFLKQVGITFCGDKSKKYSRPGKFEVKIF